MTPEEVWRRKTDEDVVSAALSLGDYTEDGRKIILAEVERRGLKRTIASRRESPTSANELKGGKGFWKSLFTPSTTSGASEPTTPPPDKCGVCGKNLSPELSGKVAAYLGLSYWPCPKCHIWGAPLIVVSDGGFVVEFPPLLVTATRKSPGDFEVLVGIGSISSPARTTLAKSASSGRDAFYAVVDALDPKNRARVLELLKGK